MKGMRRWRVACRASSALIAWILVLVAARFLKLLEAGFEFGDVLRLRPLQRNAPRQGVAHRARHRNHRGRTGRAKTGAARLILLLAHDLPLREVRQFQVFKEEIDKLFVGEREAELVFAAPVSARASPRPAGRRTIDRVALGVLFVAGEQIFANAAFVAAAQARLMHAIGGDGDFPAASGVGDLAAFGRLADGVANERARAPDEPLTIA